VGFGAAWNARAGNLMQWFTSMIETWLRQAGKEGAPAAMMTPTEFERHAGMAASKKWKYTVRIDDASAEPQPIGAWLEARGLARTSER